MIVIGAKGHATEVLQVLEQGNQNDNIVFYDGLTQPAIPLLYNQYEILSSDDAVLKSLAMDNRFVLGIGGPKPRKVLFDKFVGFGGVPVAVICSSAMIGRHEVTIGQGCNIMSQVVISNSTCIGTGVLLNRGVSIHHDVSIGDFTEVAPGAQLLGHVKVGWGSMLGAQCTILPNVEVGNNVIVGAGAVVNRNVPDNVTVAGVPARIIKENKN